MADISVILKLKDQLSNGMAQAMGNSERSVKLLDTSMKGMTRTFANIGTVLAGGWIGQKVFAGIDKFTKAAAESEVVVAKLNVALGGNTEALVEQSNQLSAKLGIDDEAIIRMQSMLGGYTKNKQAIQDLTPAILDMAEALGMDMDTAAKLVGKALRNDNDELAKYKIHVEGAAGSQERATSITKALSAAFGGQAQAANDASDKSQNVAVAMGNVAEAMGSEMLSEVRDFNSTLAAFANNTLVPFGEIASHALVDPFRIASISIMQIVRALYKFDAVFQRINMEIQTRVYGMQKGSPAQLNFEKMISDDKAMIAGLDDEITEITKRVMGIKDLPSISGTLPNFDEGGDKKKDKKANGPITYETLVGSVGGPGSKWKKELDAINAMIEIEDKANKQRIENRIKANDIIAKETKWLADFEVQVAADKLARQEALQKIEADNAKKLSEMHQDYFWQTATTFGATLVNIGQASKASAEEMRGLRLTSAIIDGAASLAGIWRVATNVSTPYETAGWAVALSALSIANTAAQVATISSQSFSTGTMYAPGGVARVHRDETIFLPRGSRVETAAQSHGGGNFAININGNVTQETMPSLRSELRTFARTMERATRGGYIDQKRLARYAA